jgi:RNA polymerase sigma-70 factor, ECF subfamily
MADDTRAPDLAEVARRARDGDSAAFRALVDLTHGALFRVALRTVGDRSDAEDVVQESYARAWQSMRSLRDPAAALGWLCRIVRNASNDRLRARSARKTTSIDDDERTKIAEQLCAPEPRADDVLASAQMRAFVHEVLASMRVKHRVVLLLKEVDGMTAEQIGVALEIPVGTVESRLVRARAILAKKIEARAKGRRWFL